MLKRTINWLVKPSPAANINLHNFRLVMLDAIGLGIASSAGPFLNVFLVSLGATNNQIGLLASMPALAGFLMVLSIGQFIQKKRNPTKFASWAVFGTYLGYFFTGILPFFVPRPYIVVSIIIAWGFVTIPQTIMGVTYPTMLYGVAGEHGRFELTTRRWALLGLVSALLTAIIGQVLELINYPINYQLIFMILSLGGVVSFSAVRKIKFDQAPPRQNGDAEKFNARQFITIFKENKPFANYVVKRFVYFMGGTLLGPVTSLYYIKDLKISVGWIGGFSTAATLSLIIGYFIWLRMSRKVSSVKILLITTFVMALWPLVLSMLTDESVILPLLLIIGLMQAGIDLVFFDELMKTIPADKSTLFISINMLFQYVANFIGPILGTTLADFIGLRGALIVGSAIKLIAFFLFTFEAINRPKNAVLSAE